jgi:hypothetical protein
MVEAREKSRLRAARLRLAPDVVEVEYEAQF